MTSPGLFVGMARAAGFEASGGFVATRNSLFVPAKPDNLTADELNAQRRIVRWTARTSSSTLVRIYP